jgi:nucleotide-binding universal stress UspA family protein
MAGEERAHPDGRDGPHERPWPQEDAFELGTDGPKVLVVGVDGTDTAARAAAYAVGLARRQNSRLVFIYVQPVGGPFGVTAASAAIMAASHDEMAGELSHRIRHFMNEFGKRDWEFRTVRGDIFAELSRVADEVKADGVLVGASMQAGHRIAGSIAVRLVRAGRWPVTVVP